MTSGIISYESLGLLGGILDLRLKSSCSMLSSVSHSVDLPPIHEVGLGGKLEHEIK
jgi:hypothetical protein